MKKSAILYLLFISLCFANEINENPIKFLNTQTVNGSHKDEIKIKNYNLEIPYEVNIANLVNEELKKEHSIAIFTEVKDLIDNYFNPETIMETTKKLLNIDINTFDRNNFLGNLSLSNEEEIELFVNGFFEGVSSVPFKDNQCIHDISEVKSNIINVFLELINSIKSKSGIVQAIENVYKLLRTLSELEANCRFDTLSNDIISLSTKTGMVKLTFRIVSHFLTFSENLKDLYISYESKQFRKSGIEMGLLTKLTLDYSTK